MWICRIWLIKITGTVSSSKIERFNEKEFHAEPQRNKEAQSWLEINWGISAPHV
jgi:hypothetical protein